jgi:hypothetical protein
MKKLGISLFVSALLVSTSAFGETKLDEGVSPDHTFEPLAEFKNSDILDGWIFSGDIRTGYVRYDYGNKAHPENSPRNVAYTNNQGHLDSKGYYFVPKLSLTTPTVNNIKAKVTVSAATDFGINDEVDEVRNFVFDPQKRESFAMFQEGYISYEDGEHKLLVGREELITPMIDSDDWYMLANSFDVAYYVNNSFENIEMSTGYFYRMAGVWDSGSDDGTNFYSMSDSSFVSSADKEGIDRGVYFASFQYNDEKNHNLKIWEYYARDLYNIAFLQYDYTAKLNSFKYDAGLQYINFSEVGQLASHHNTNINYSLYSARFDGSFDFGLDFATGVSKYTDGEGQGATLGAFGGYPYFANGMIFHFFEAGSLQNAASYKAQVGYDLSKIGLKDIWVGYRYTYFDLDSEYSQTMDGENQTKMILNGVKISYAGDNGLYLSGTYENVDLDKEPTTYAFRLIGGYKF